MIRAERLEVSVSVSPFGRVIASARPRAVGRVSAGIALRVTVALAGVAVAALFWSGAVGAALSPAARSSLAVASVAVGLWASELLALPVTAILAVVLLSVTGAAPKPEQALAGFAAPVLFFLLGSAALGIAAEHTGLADRLAAWLLTRARGSGRRLLLDLLLTLPAQALIVPSAMSRNAVLVPVYERVLLRVGRPPRLGMAVMLGLGVLGPLASSALLTGGTSPVAAAEAIGGFTWISWLVALAPPYYVLLAVDALVLWLFTRPERSVVVNEPPDMLTDMSSAAGSGLSTEDAWPKVDRPRRGLSAAEWRVAAISTGTAALWMLDTLTGWSPAFPALLALALLLTPALGVMTWQQFSVRAPWGTCVVLAGAVSLGGALTRTGAAAWMAQGLFGRLGAPSGAVPMALAIALVTAIITLGIPNRAAAITLIIPLAVAYAATGSLAAPAAGLVVLMVVDAETIYPAQTAANLIAYDRGYFSAGRLAAFNLLTLAATALVIVAVALPWWSFVGLPGAR